MSIMEKGDILRECVDTVDRATGRPLLRLTTTGHRNQKPTYHLGACFSADSRELIFCRDEGGESAVLKANLETGDLTVLAVANVAPDRRGEPDDPATWWFEGCYLSMIPALRKVVARQGKRLLLIDLDSLDERVLIENIGREYQLGVPIGTPQGDRVFVTRFPEHPDWVNRRPQPHRTYNKACWAEFNGTPTTFLEIELDSGRVRELYHDPTFGCIHVQPSPADPDLLLIDRDAPPSVKDPADGGIPTRHWLFHTRTGKFTELRPRNANRFQIHSVWNWNGTRTFYHGASGKGMYVGVWDVAGGGVLWEQELPEFLYGHTSSHPARDRFITDGLFTRDHLVAVGYEECDRFGAPRLEILGYHGSDMSDYPRYGQAAHPHCHVSPDGRWLAYNKTAGDGRTDIWVLDCELI